MFPALDASLVPLRLAITAVIPPDPLGRTTITLTCDPPSDRFAVMWYSDTVVDVLTPDEMCQAIYAMVDSACATLARGVLYDHDDPSVLPGIYAEPVPPFEQLTIA